jgi:hypothetical protein
MTDSRFTSTVDDVGALLQVVDVDEVEDIETLLMFLFARPIGVGEAWDDEGLAPSVRVVVRGNEASIESHCDFPLSMIELARACAEMVDGLGPNTGDDFVLGEAVSDVSAMSDPELVGALQQALGKTRLFNMTEDNE